MAPGYRLAFRLKGGWATVDRLADLPEGGEQAAGECRDVHGAILPVSQDEMSRIAATEGGYYLQEIEVVPYGSATAIKALSFVGERRSTLIIVIVIMIIMMIIVVT